VGGHGRPVRPGVSRRGRVLLRGTQSPITPAYPGHMSISPLSITYEEYLNVDQHSEQKSFIIGQALEKVSHAGFTGEGFGGGRALLLDFKGVGTPGAAPEDRVARCHVLLIHQTAMSITESGVLVSM